jgi:hypothetical protein
VLAATSAASTTYIYQLCNCFFKGTVHNAVRLLELHATAIRAQHENIRVLVATASRAVLCAFMQERKKTMAGWWVALSA